MKCAPPDNKPARRTRELHQYLQRELALLSQLRVVVCLGAFAYEAAAQSSACDRARSSFMASKSSRRTVCTSCAHFIRASRTVHRSTDRGHCSTLSLPSGRVARHAAGQVTKPRYERTFRDLPTTPPTREPRIEMDKQVINTDVPTTGGPFNLCIRHGNMVMCRASPFDEQYSLAFVRRGRRRTDPPFPETPFRRAGSMCDGPSPGWWRPRARHGLLVEGRRVVEGPSDQEASIASIAATSAARKSLPPGRACRPVARRGLRAGDRRDRIRPRSTSAAQQRPSAAPAMLVGGHGIVEKIGEREEPWYMPLKRTWLVGTPSDASRLRRRRLRPRNGSYARDQQGRRRCGHDVIGGIVSGQSGVGEVRGIGARRSDR